MADEAAHTTDIGELRGQVRGLQAGFDDLGQRLDRGLQQLGDAIRSSTERTNERIESQQQRTDARFEALAQASLSAANAKGAQSWQVFTYIGSGIIGIAGLAATFYSLTRSPIDANFARDAAAIAKLIDTTVPEKQLNVQFATVNAKLDSNTDRLQKAEIALAKTQQKAEDQQQQISENRQDMKEAHAASATKSQIADVNDRITTVSNRLQTVYDKNYVPAVPTSSPPPTAGAPGR